MDNLFFIASKTLGMIVRVETWIVAGMIVTVLAGVMGRGRLARWAGLVTLIVTLGMTVFPLANPLLARLESQYPPSPALPDKIDGIIVLGGAEDTMAYARWGLTGLNEGGERMTEGAILARRFPQAKLIFTGGSASLVYDDDPNSPSAMTHALWRALGVPEAQITLETRSRNTSENAIFTKDIIQPQPGQNWLLVTSAFHMPRSMETFARNGWTGLIAWPVDFRSGESMWRAEWRLDEHLTEADVTFKEYLGLLAYRWAGK